MKTVTVDADFHTAASPIFWMPRAAISTHEATVIAFRKIVGTEPEVTAQLAFCACPSVQERVEDYSHRLKPERFRKRIPLYVHAQLPHHRH
jgi:hypothetical protein